MKIELSTAIHATEEPELVAKALRNILPDVELIETKNGLGGRSGKIAPLRRRIWELRIIDAFRSSLLANIELNSTMVRLNKQAAIGGHVSLAVKNHPLGDIKMRIELEESDPSQDINALIAWICPETLDGEIIGNTEGPWE